MHDVRKDKFDVKTLLERYVLNPLKNNDRHMLSGVCLVYLPFVISTA
jgi:hypothetical protein